MKLAYPASVGDCIICGGLRQEEPCTSSNFQEFKALTSSGLNIVGRIPLGCAADRIANRQAFHLVGS